MGRHSEIYKKKKRKKRKLRDETGEDDREVKPYLTEARRAGGELSDLHRLIIIGVVLVVRIDVVITIRTG